MCIQCKSIPFYKLKHSIINMINGFHSDLF